jgi:hypothetical protein
MTDIQSNPQIKSLLIATDTPLESSIVYSNPLIMAVITRSQLAEIAPFALPFTQNVTMGSVSHSYSSNCESFMQIEQFTLMITLGYLIMILLWTMNTWYVFGQWN